jgi:hypothetical protein
VTSTVLHVPAGSRLQPDAPLGQLKLAVARALLARMTEACAWSDLTLVTGTEWLVRGNSTLLDAQQAGGDAYVAHVHEVVPTVLGLREEGDDFHFLDVPPPREVHLDHLPALEEHLDLPNWLADNEPRLYRLLYAGGPATAAALDAVTSAIADLDLLEITKQLDRLRRDLTDDRPAAIGHAKGAG